MSIHQLAHSSKALVFSDSPLELKGFAHLKECKSMKVADISISKLSENLYSLCDNSITENFSKDNLLKFFKSLDFFFQTNIDRKDNLKKIQKHNVYKSKKKDISQFSNKFSTTYQNIIKELIKSEKLDDIPKKLSQLDELKSYSSYIMLTLHKGRSQAFVTDYENNDAKKYYFSSNSFNTIFNSIKKSKGNSFSFQKSLSEELKLVGSFLAHTFILNKMTIILIVSRNDFIEATQTEQTVFGSFVTQLDLAFNYIENRNSLIQDANFYLKIFDFVGYKIQLESPDGIFISNAKEHQSFNLSYSRPNAPMTLRYHMTENSYFTADIFHYHRIRLLGELFNILKHELSNPILGINLALDILSGSKNLDAFSDLTHEIKLASKRAQGILENMTNLFVEDQSKVEITISEVIETLIAILKSELRLVKYTVEVQEDIKNISLQTNISSVIQILFNLIHNSIQELKNKKDEKLVKIHVFKDSKNIIFEINDNGAGLPEKILDNLFKPFLSFKKDGNGLGLSISKSLAIKNGGDLLLINSDNTGATFHLLIPLLNGK